jgi:hypothetical protein
VSRAAGEESVVKDVLQPDRDDVSAQWASTERECPTVGEIEIAPMTGIEPAMGA